MSANSSRSRRHAARRRKKNVRRLASPNAWRIVLLFALGALLAGLAALLLAYGSEAAHRLFRLATTDYPWLPLLLLPAGFVLITLLMRLFPGSEGSGIPQTIAALHTQHPNAGSRLLSLRIAAGKTLMVLVGIGCGASIGREGPTVHVAASIMDSMRRFARLPGTDYRRSLIVAGAAAGIAAAFNTPLAGVVFAVEELSRSYEQRLAGNAMSAAILAGMIALAVHGKYYYFGTVNPDVGWLASLAGVAICGVAGGLFGGGFSWLLVHGNRRLAPHRRHSPLIFAALCGLAAALIGIASGGVTYGTGYEEAAKALANGDGVGGSYPLLKWAATLVCYWSGIPGGIFAPSLSIGAALGQQIALILPQAPVVAFALLGMAAYFAGVVQAPLTAVVIVMEMTDSHGMLLPVMAAAMVGNWVSRLISHPPVYMALAEDFIARLDGEHQAQGDKGR